MPELDRRHFLKLVGASAGAAAAAGCSDPVEKLVPYVIQPEEITPGISVDYASTCRECAAGCGLQVTTREGRPIKLEGNPNHPINRGALCARGQAAIMRSYHPDRYEGAMVRKGGVLERASWEEALGVLTARLAGGTGASLRVLGRDPGPTLGSLIDGFIGALGGDPATQHLVYEPFSQEAIRKAAGAVFGVETLPIFDLSGADLILDFGSEFIDTGPSPVEHMRQFAEAQDLQKHPEGGARLVYVGPRLTLTGSNADQWIPARPGSEGMLALALAKRVFDRALQTGREIPGDASAVARALSGVDPQAVAREADVDPATLDALAEELMAARAPLVLPPGVAATSQRATASAAAVLLLDALLGAVGRGVHLPERETAAVPASFEQVRRLVQDMQAGRVDVLLIHGTNPVYSLPAELGFAEALESVALVVSFAPLADETSERAGLVLPDHTDLESWGDLTPRAGVRSLVQPTLRPLKDTQALGDTLLAAGRALGDRVSGALPSGSFRSVLERAWSDTNFRTALATGGVFGDTRGGRARPITAGVANLEFREPQLEGTGDFVLVTYPHSFLGDGRSATLPWAQEIPDPVTKAAWQSWLEVSQATARKLGVDFGDVVSVDTGFGSADVPVYPRGGIRDDTIALAIGQGHTVGYYASLAGDGEPGVARGASAISLLPARTDESGGGAWLVTRASLRPTGGFRRIPLSQWTDNQRGRNLAPQVSLASLAAGHDGGHGNDDGHHGGTRVASAHFEHTEAGVVAPFDRENDARSDSPYRWGMTIDNDRCTGCSACVVACSIENNVPTVGEEGIIRHREMTWIRLERYNGDGDLRGGEERRPYPDREELGVTDVRIVPMLCQQCGSAPCESVCPVIATYHTPDGLNAMIYNRCVGTRYCANNCVYKVRRFNYFDYSQTRLPGLLGLMMNPDVTVREQGVMEKCTFCVQRIQSARQVAKDEGRDIADGEVQTACQQSCPTQAITFGNTRDPKSRVVTRVDADQNRSYTSLPTLNARPSITYLTQVKRGAGEGERG
ncbi:MAG: 4Fe-4S dicluster domain-containing protein [Proteobacteria bacterium]|nr:4Fe-4S dicluster domain-containing protein [Pseudomonadota bacterium]